MIAELRRRSGQSGAAKHVHERMLKMAADPAGRAVSGAPHIVNYADDFVILRHGKAKGRHWNGRVR